MPVIRLPLVASLILILTAAAPTRADDWPQFRGPDREGVWREEGIVESFPAKGLPVLWRAPVGAGFSGPAVAGGRVFLMDRVLDESAPQDVKYQWNHRDTSRGKERVVCLDENTGKEIWTRDYPCAYDVAYGSGPRATPTVAGDKVITLGAMGDLLCLDAASGKVIWQKNFVRDYAAQVPSYGYAGAPLVDGQRVIAVVGGEEHTVVAFDLATGRELWKSGSASEPGYCAPIIRTLAGRRQLIVWHGDGLVGMVPESGKILWKVHHSTMAGMSIATPAVDGERMAVSSQFEGTMLLEFANVAGTLRVPSAPSEPEESGPKIVWKKTASGSVPEKPFKKAGMNTTMSTVLLTGGHVYGVSCYGETCCLDAANGSRVWTTLQPTSGGSQPHDRWCTAFFVPHRVPGSDKTFIFNEKGDLIIARLRPSGYEELSRTHLLDPDMSSSGGAGRKVIWSHPAYADRSIFVRNNHEIIRVSLAK